MSVPYSPIVGDDSASSSKGSLSAPLVPFSSGPPPSNCKLGCAKFGFILSCIGFVLGIGAGLTLATKIHSLDDSEWPTDTGFNTNPEIEIMVIFLANAFKVVAIMSLLGYGFFYRVCHQSYPCNLFISRHMETLDTLAALPIIFSLISIANKVYFLNNINRPDLHVDDSSFSGTLFNTSLIPNIFSFSNALNGKFFQFRILPLSDLSGAKTWRRNITGLLGLLFFLYMVMVGNMWAYWQRNQAFVNYENNGQGFQFTYTQMLLLLTFYFVTYAYGDAAVLNFVGGLSLDIPAMIAHPATTATGRFICFCVCHPLVKLTNTYVVVIHLAIAFSHWEFATDVQPFDFCIMARVGVAVFAAIFVISNVRIITSVVNHEGWSWSAYLRLRKEQMKEFLELYSTGYVYQPLGINVMEGSMKTVT